MYLVYPGLDQYMRTGLNITTLPAFSRCLVTSLLQDYLTVPQAFRESAPLDLSLGQYWGYPKDMEWMLIIAIKLAFIVVFEVFLF